MTQPRTVTENDPVGLLPDAGRRFAVLVGIFALQLSAFVVCVVLLSLGAGLAVLVVGLFVLAAGLLAAGWAARMQRLLLAHAGVDLPPTRPGALAPGWRGRLRPLTRPQSWRDLLHVLVAFPVSIVTFSSRSRGSSAGWAGSPSGCGAARCRTTARA